MNGVKVIKIGLGTPKMVRFNWWIDPARGYALLKHELVGFTPAGEVDETRTGRFEITDLVEAAPGLWYPREAYYYIPAEDDPKLSRRRVHYKAASVVANDPKFDPALFDPPIPTGYTVTDSATGKTHRITPATRPLDADLKKAVEDGLRATGAATQGAK